MVSGRTAGTEIGWAGGETGVRRFLLDRMCHERYNKRRNGRKPISLMSGRYYIDDDTTMEIEKLVRQVDERMRQAPAVGKGHPSKQDIK